MNRRFFVALFLITTTFTIRADQRSSTNARNALTDLIASANELSKEAQRDGEVLRLIEDSARSLDDFQVNKAVTDAMQAIVRAERVSAASSPAVKKAIADARKIVEPASESLATANLAKMRDDLYAKPISQLRAVLAEDINELAFTASQVADVSGILTRAVAAASAASLGKK